MPPWKTTWGAEPFQDQVRPSTATVAEKLAKQGAVVMAKVTLARLLGVMFGLVERLAIHGTLNKAVVVHRLEAPRRWRLG